MTSQRKQELAEAYAQTKETYMELVQSVKQDFPESVDLEDRYIENYLLGPAEYHGANYVKKINQKVLLLFDAEQLVML